MEEWVSLILNLNIDIDMEEEHKFGKMVQYMKDIGIKMLLVEKVD